MNRLKVNCTHRAPDIPVDVYLRGYVAKRTYDSGLHGGSSQRVDDGGMQYTLEIPVPNWVRMTLRLPPMYFNETVRRNEHGAIVIYARCDEADVTVNTVVQPHADGGTTVATDVDLVNTYRGLSLPVGIVRAVVGKLFRSERARDREYALPG